jgi:hypothetical protein
MLDTYLRDHGMPAVVEEVIGDYPSPTLVIGGVDVITQRPPTSGAAYCRLDLPTKAHIAGALRKQPRP